MASLINGGVPDDSPTRPSASLLNRIANNPVGTETMQSMGMQRGPFDEIAAMTPQGQPVMRSALDVAHAQIAQAMELAPTVALGMVGDAPGGKGFTAYHGSPHSFDAFDSSKIGTGEGAQAYGHGLYVAGNEGVARSYRDNLSNPVHELLDQHGNPVIQDSGGTYYSPYLSTDDRESRQVGTALRRLLDARGDFDTAINGTTPQTQQILQRMHDQGSLPTYNRRGPQVGWTLNGEDIGSHITPGTTENAKSFALDWLRTSDTADGAIARLKAFGNDDADAAANWLKDNQSKIAPVYGSPGHMYEVQVNADPAHFLDWDKPLSEQSPHVQQALAKVGVQGGYQVVGPNGVVPVFHSSAEAAADAAKAIDGAKGITKADDIPGQLAYYRLAGKLTGNKSLSSPEAAAALRDAGIPGIRYLDGGSRASGEGTHNHVIFDADTMAILRKYGLAGLMAGGAATATARGDGNAVE